MSDKAAKKKQFILDTAKNIFCEKGFKDVTMKDIVEACDISRGGLYIYFDSTEAIFETVIKDESANKQFIPDAGDITPGDLLALFLTEQKKAILDSEDDLSVALYEYMFYKYAAGSPCTFMKDKFESEVKALSALIEAGIESGEIFEETESELAARNILFTLEGIKMASKTVGMTDEEIDEQLVYMLGGLVLLDEE